jgi:DNA-binding CsgD family transcriptional regulator
VPLPHGLVSGRPFVVVHETLRAGGIPQEAFSAEVLATLARARTGQGFVAWDHFIAQQDQARAWCGDDRRYVAACANFDRTFPEMKAFADEHIRAQAFCRFIFDAFDAPMFPDVRHEARELPDGSVELELWVAEHLCDSTSWMLGNVGALPVMTRLLGMPPAQMEASHGSHHGLFRLRFPPEAAARTGGATPAMRAMADLSTTLRANVQLAVSEARGAPAAPRVEQLARRWSLTARQAEVLALICKGRANKQIALDLQCAVRTVEIHVSDILRKAQVVSRAALVAALLAPGP